MVLDDLNSSYDYNIIGEKLESLKTPKLRKKYTFPEIEISKENSCAYKTPPKSQKVYQLESSPLEGSTAPSSSCYRNTFNTPYSQKQSKHIKESDNPKSNNYSDPCNQLEAYAETNFCSSWNWSSSYSCENSLKRSNCAGLHTEPENFETVSGEHRENLTDEPCDEANIDFNKIAVLNNGNSTPRINSKKNKSTSPADCFEFSKTYRTPNRADDATDISMPTPNAPQRTTRKIHLGQAIAANSETLVLKALELDADPNSEVDIYELSSNLQLRTLPILAAAARAQHAIIQILIDYGAVIDAVNQYNQTALQLVCIKEDFVQPMCSKILESDRLKTAKILLTNGVSLNHIDFYGFTAQQYAEKYHFLSVLHYFQTMDIDMTPKSLPFLESSETPTHKKLFPKRNPFNNPVVK